MDILPSSLFRQSLDASNLAHIITSASNDCIILYANPAFYALSGYTPEEVLGQNCRFLQGAGTDPKILQYISTQLKQAKDVDVEVLNYRKDGTSFWNRLRIAAIYDDDGQLAGFIGTQSDMTEIKARERIFADRQKIESLGLLSANVSHEIKNALQPIKLMAETLRDEDNLSREDKKQCLDTMLSNIQIADLIVMEILRYSRPADQVIVPLSIHELADEFANFLKYVVPKTVHCKAQLDALPKDLEVRVNQNQLYQIILNILNNALDAMNQVGQFSLHCHLRSISVDLSLEFGISQGDYLALVFRDTGTGIPDELIGNIFDPFFSSKPPDKGTGLGLSISQKLAQGWGGQIVAENLPEEGCEMTLLLPVYKQGIT